MPTAVASLIRISGIIQLAELSSDSIIISASSEVAINTASSVPVRIKPLSYSFAAITEKPHCGTMPVAEPISGARLPCRMFLFWVRDVLCSKISIKI